MQRLTNEHLFKNYPHRDDAGNFHPPLIPEEPPLRVRQGESFLIETPEKFITVGVKHEVREAVTDAIHAMSELLAAAQGINILDAYQFVSHVGDIHVGAMWPMWSEWHIPVPMCLHLDRRHFG